jgi:hypothetical protein
MSLKSKSRIIGEGAQSAGVPPLERVTPDVPLPCVEIRWTKRELESLALFVSASEANQPTELLIRAIRT